MAKLLIVGRFWDGTPFSASAKIQVKGKRKHDDDKKKKGRKDRDD